MVVEPQHGRVERSAPEIVNEHVLALAGERALLAMRVLAGGGRGFVQQAHHIKAGGAEGIDREQALAARRVRRNADGGLDHLCRGAPGVAADNFADVREEAREEFAEQESAAGEFHRGQRSRAVEQALQRAQAVPARLMRRADRSGFPSVNDAAIRMRGDERRADVVFAERDHGKIPAIDERCDRVGGSEIDADAHGKDLSSQPTALRVAR